MKNILRNIMIVAMLAILASCGSRTLSESATSGDSSDTGGAGEATGLNIVMKVYSTDTASANISKKSISPSKSIAIKKSALKAVSADTLSLAEFKGASCVLKKLPEGTIVAEGLSSENGTVTFENIDNVTDAYVTCDKDGESYSKIFAVSGTSGNLEVTLTPQDDFAVQVVLAELAEECGSLETCAALYSSNLITMADSYKGEAVNGLSDTSANTNNAAMANLLLVGAYIKDPAERLQIIKEVKAGNTTRALESARTNGLNISADKLSKVGVATSGIMSILKDADSLSKQKAGINVIRVIGAANVDTYASSSSTYTTRLKEICSTTACIALGAYCDGNQNEMANLIAMSADDFNAICNPAEIDNGGRDEGGRDEGGGDEGGGEDDEGGGEEPTRSIIISGINETDFVPISCTMTCDSPYTASYIGDGTSFTITYEGFPMNMGFACSISCSDGGGNTLGSLQTGGVDSFMIFADSMEGFVFVEAEGGGDEGGGEDPELLGAGAFCSANEECSSGSCNVVCLAALGEACGLDSECASNSCVEGLCTEGGGDEGGGEDPELLGAGAFCSANEECSSGSCNVVCLAANGGVCETNDQCLSNLCDDQNIDPDITDLVCLGTDLVLEASCIYDAQCSSGNCNGDFVCAEVETRSFIVNGTIAEGMTPPLTCSLFQAAVPLHSGVGYVAGDGLAFSLSFTIPSGTPIMGVSVRCYDGAGTEVGSFTVDGETMFSINALMESVDGLLGTGL